MLDISQPGRGVSRSWRRLRGRATGISAAGINVGEVVLAPLVLALIATIGWRGAWAVVQSLVWADYFGRGFLGAIRGYVSPFQLLATVGGPTFAAYVFDETSSYMFALWTFFAARG